MANIKKKLDIFMDETFQVSRLEEVVGDRFGRYSKYIIQERAIPDIRDGLKPVQRRILYAMNELKITANAPYKKSARITGEVMGKYHPHGDSSIYEALVRMSQNWKMGVTLIDMHGNNGSMDGDGPAAMRYTEARMSKNAEYLLKDIDKNTVPFIPNFDEEEQEPTVLPARFPNLLVNGAMGISSGYATYIPTHNFNEVIEATIARLKNPDLTLDELLAIMPGPDFPTGGIVIGTDGIREAFLTGAGAVIVRSKYHLEEMSGGNKRVVVTEVPYDTIKAKTVEKIEQLRLDGKIPDLAEVRDESGREGLRIALDLKKDANVDAIMAYLFKNTDLQVTVNYNMVSICNRRPMRLGVLPILDAYISHQKEVLTNRTNYEMQKAKKRLHIVEGLVKMVSIVDEVIQTIRSSKNKADSKQNIMNAYGFTDEQAEAIVMMQLYRLSTQDITLLKEEDQELSSDIVRYEKILTSEKELIRLLIQELTEMNKTLVVGRKTQIDAEASANIKFDETDLISKEQVMVSLSKDGYMKRTSLKSYNSSKQNGLKENDSVLFCQEVSTLDTLLIFTTLGNFIYLPVHKIQECKFKEVGTYINSIVAIQPNEKLIQAFAVSDFNCGDSIVLITALGTIKQTLLSEFNVNRYSKPIRAMRLSENDRLVSADRCENPLEIMIFTKRCEALRFRASDVSLYGTNAGGVRGINLKPKDEVVSVLYTNKEQDFLLLTSKLTLKRMRVSEVVLTKRSRSGSYVIKPVKSNPTYLLAARTLSCNQLKENVTIEVRYQNGTDGIEAKSLKYNVSDIGRSIQTEAYRIAEDLYVPPSKEKDKMVSGDYLIEVRDTIFNYDDGVNEIPLISKTTKKETDIVDELDRILVKEGRLHENNLFNLPEEEPKEPIENSQEESVVEDDLKEPIESTPKERFAKDDLKDLDWLHDEDTLPKEPKAPETKREEEIKITEGDRFIVKETKSSLFIREKEEEPKKLKVDSSEEEEQKEIQYKKFSLFEDD